MDGELDEISFKLGEVSNGLLTLSQNVTDLNGKVDTMLALCPARKIQLDHNTQRIEDLEKKDVLGGTTKFEKIIIGLGVFGTGLKWAYDLIFSG